MKAIINANGNLVVTKFSTQQRDLLLVACEHYEAQWVYSPAIKGTDYERMLIVQTNIEDMVAYINSGNIEERLTRTRESN